MSDKIVIHALPGSSRCTSVIVTALLTKTNFELKVHHPSELKTDAYLKIHPFGKVPAIETKEGPLFESNTISRYLARQSKSLYGKDAHEQALIDQWLDNIRMDIVQTGKTVYGCFGWPNCVPTKDQFDKGVTEHVNNLKVIDAHLKNNQFLVGAQLSIADVVLVSDLAYWYRLLFTEAERKALVHLTAYFERLVKLPEFKNLVGAIPQIESRVPIKFCNKHHDDKKEKKKDDKKDDKKKDDKKKDDKKKEEKKKEEKPAKKAEADDDEIKEEKLPEYKFPDTTFNFFEFKTLYVNEPDKQKALDFLWKNWDANAFSFWRLRYDKLSSEGKVVYLTNNLMNGFLDRADACRKHTLGVHGVYGDEPDLDVRGVWMWRGTEILPYLKDHQQFEYYQATKLDPANEKDKAIITEYWTHLKEDVDKVEGLTVRTCKLFK